jgi:CubicO group peptidase (beta-lactamase class C family)
MAEVVYSNQAYLWLAISYRSFREVPYKQYIQEHIFNPLEMTCTALLNHDPIMEERLSIPYVVDEKTGSQVWNGAAQGGGMAGSLVYGTVLNQANG